MFRRLFLIAILTSLPVLTGCMHFVHKDPTVDAYAWRVSDHVPQESKSCVFVFMFDPIGSGSLIGVRDYINDLGFGKTYYGQPPHLSYFVEKMQWIRARSEHARFVVMGCGTAAEAARKLVELAGVPVDISVYLEPKGLDEWVDDETAKNTIVVRADDLVDSRAADGKTAKSHAVSTSEVPTHPQTLDLIERELSAIGMSVPPPKRPPAPCVLLVEPIPPPRDTPADPQPLPPEWQFLRPQPPWATPLPWKPRAGEILPLPKVVPNPPIPKAKP